MPIQILILLGLIVINGIFAMSEIAVVSSNRARLEADAEDGNDGAQTALELLDDPNRFLSSVQIGITLVGVVAGAFGGTALADDIARLIDRLIPRLSPISTELGFGLIVTLTTYLSLVIGELVPKRIALANPEGIASRIARPMQLLAMAAAPLVWVLTTSTGFVTRILGVKTDDRRFITDFEVIAMVREGITQGEFDHEEHSMVKGVLELDDTRIREIATPRTDIVWLDINAPDDALRDILMTQLRTAYPVCEDKIDQVVGIVRAKDILRQMLGEGQLDLRAIMREPLFVPETALAADLLQHFKRSVVRMAILVGEFGGVEGVITLNDIVAEVLGDLDNQIMMPQETAGIWRFDGQYPVEDIPYHLPDFYLPKDEAADYRTLGGFILKRLGHIPSPNEQFEWHGYQLEVVEMDGQRVQRVTITLQRETDAE